MRKVSSEDSSAKIGDNVGRMRTSEIQLLKKKGTHQIGREVAPEILEERRGERRARFASLLWWWILRARLLLIKPPTSPTPQFFLPGVWPIGKIQISYSPRVDLFNGPGALLKALSQPVNFLNCWVFTGSRSRALKSISNGYVKGLACNFHEMFSY